MSHSKKSAVSAKQSDASSKKRKEVDKLKKMVHNLEIERDLAED